MLLWRSCYGSMLALKFGTSKGPPSPYPSLQFRSTASQGWQCHSHRQGHTRELLHALLVKTDSAIPFRKQSGHIYPKSKTPSLMKSSHVPVTAALSGTESFNRIYCGQPRNSMQSWKRMEEFQQCITVKWETKKQDAERNIWFNLIFMKQWRKSRLCYSQMFNIIICVKEEWSTEA